MQLTLFDLLREFLSKTSSILSNCVKFFFVPLVRSSIIIYTRCYIPIFLYRPSSTITLSVACNTQKLNYEWNRRINSTGLSTTSRYTIIVTCHKAGNTLIFLALLENGCQSYLTSYRNFSSLDLVKSIVVKM